MRAWGLVVAVALLAMGSVGCGDDDGGGSTCAAAVNKLRSCGLTDDTVIADCEEPTNSAESCQSNCYLNASCGDLESLFCDTVLEAGLTSCLANCPEGPEFACGVEDETVGQDDRCDGFDDCSNAADEEGCPTFECATGDETFPASYECDAFDDCADGSDEVNCPDPLVLTCE